MCRAHVQCPEGRVGCASGSRRDTTPYALISVSLGVESWAQSVSNRSLTKEGSREARMGAPEGRVRMREWSSALGPLEATTPGGAADVRSYVSVHVSADLYK